MKLLEAFGEQLKELGEIRYAWFTSFNINVEFIETYLLPAVLGLESPRTRYDYEQFQQALIQRQIDFRVFCDRRFIEAHQNKRTAIPIHGVFPGSDSKRFAEESLFHPKVIYLEGHNGKRIIGAGSANLTLSGWGRNQEVFCFLPLQKQQNYQEIRAFFNWVFERAGEECPLQEKTRLHKVREEAREWQFYFTSPQSNFVDQLIEGCDGNVAVWSPYLPKNLASFVTHLQETSGQEGLRIHLVADRLKGRFRTQWTKDLATLEKQGAISFYNSPVPCCEDTELCHAKIWKTENRLAIGSWNFTGPGSNSIRNDKGRWSPLNNVEAGFLIEDDKRWQQALGARVEPASGDFADLQSLEDGLLVPKLPPFDLHVVFDWSSRHFSVEAEWIKGVPNDSYEVKLPGIRDLIPLRWSGRVMLKLSPLSQPDEKDLLRDHTFSVRCGEQTVYRGLITEKGLKLRRVQAFNTLGDLLEAAMHGEDTESMEDIPFRLPVDESGEEVGEDGRRPETDEGVPVPVLTRDALQDSISYFGLFQAVRQYAARLQNAEYLEDLDLLVFSRPGCLLELVEKTRKEVDQPMPSIFRWFLAQEVCALCAVASKRKHELARTKSVRGVGYAPVPNGRWKRELLLRIPALSVDVRQAYLERIKVECGYASE